MARHYTEEPMIVWASPRSGYPSSTTLQRTYDDGTVEFACAFPECEFTTPSRLGVRGHWNGHVRRGEAEPAARPHTYDVPDGPHEKAWRVRRGFVAEGEEPEEVEQVETSPEPKPEVDTEAQALRLRVKELEAALAECQQQRQEAENDLRDLHEMTARWK
jgi:hypothetical protein